MSIIAHHLVFTAYGWWPPNDPRGSMSRVIRNDVIAELGELHYGRKKVQPVGAVLRTFGDAARKVLQHELLAFSHNDIELIGASFSDVIQKHAYTCYACALMPDHVHLLIRRHRDDALKMIERFQEASREHLIAAGSRDVDHPAWGGPGWKVYCDTPDDVWRTSRYIEDNPDKIGRPKQVWDFVVPYDGWTPASVRIVR
jgi:REP element-mobilizing transposase RayT